MFALKFHDNFLQLIYIFKNDGQNLLLERENSCIQRSSKLLN